MAQEKVADDGSIRRSRVMMLVILLRVLALLATTAATVVMALNKESHTFAVATIGNTPVKITLTAKFQHTPANM
ncbi:putative casparian strip membrane protein [Helianthus annuus]|nr:putative casparian strip membrane protein [Helianthus annuus]KAJ0518334.1 putative casparian strip membrane protein [Helianthus annuus]KAJ0686367.1 putative casparian strip membrane protein [Helianthus annuus]KAJ0690188.1 putative casparian strip membrane protein [Helianthus annuus]KAJ0735305.1 putative casparian strip membrane protein [Helianthus annuus]